MVSNTFRGTGVALVTPLNDKLEFDYQGLARVLTHTSKLDYWVINGTTGESPTIKVSERKAILEFIGNNNPNRLPIMYGMGGNNTQRVLHQIENTDFTNIQAILSVCPYYNKPTQEGIFQHYKKIAEQSPVPVVLYNVPGRTAINIQAATTLRLAEHPNIIGIKEATDDLSQIKEIASHKPEGFLLTSGDDMNTKALMELGGEGVISVMANAFPYQMKQLVDFCFNHQWIEAQGVLEVLLPINPLMYKESNPVGVKKMLELLGICEGHVRLPLVHATDSLSHELSQALEELLEQKKSD